MNGYNKKNNSSPTKWLPVVVFLLFMNPVLILPAALCGGIFWLAYQGVKKQQSGSAKSASSTRYTTRQEKFDECPQSLFCRHKDKAIHHVRRGKEIDPWDRPDIDISKYQRK
jgi:hypothetical protein